MLLTTPPSLKSSLLLSLLLTPLPSLAQFQLPALTGPYTVAQTTAKLTDTNRTDPYDPANGTRNVMITLFTPVPPRSCQQTCQLPYMPPQTAALINAGATALYGIPENTFSSFSIPACCKTSNSASSSFSKVPLILFSPGLQGSRLLYSYLAATLSSHGYIVATLDHTYEAMVVEYPDGTLIPGLNDTFFDPRVPGLLDTALAVRVADSRFVLNQLGKADVVKKLLPGASCGLNTKSVGFYGHSFGGATAIAAASSDPRFLAAANLDGRQFGDLSSLRPQQSILFFGRAEPNPHNRTDDETWQTGFAAAKGWKRVLGLKDSAHSTFADFVVLAEVARLPLSEELKELVGGLEAGRVVEILGTYVKSFFGRVLKGERTGLFEGGKKEFPEVVVDGVR
ncbi:Alpha/Beta hydrolase protein [Dendryphion nanum]|uniref:1-alkyl-2-acetylglycerophosphocholine esterase n=1 Tax=Dendryphion nanum TaxID=256645 RepID=A0A9P9CY85_9PLEO|nr:Alpha/Beta hydrolase protein [Dendryphion nanum]